MKSARVKYSKRCPRCKAHFEEVWKECTSCKLPLKPAWQVDILEFLHSLFWGTVNCVLLIVLLAVIGYGVQKDKRSLYRQAFGSLIAGDMYGVRHQIERILK